MGALPNGKVVSLLSWIRDGGKGGGGAIESERCLM